MGLFSRRKKKSPKTIILPSLSNPSPGLNNDDDIYSCRFSTDQTYASRHNESSLSVVASSCPSSSGLVSQKGDFMHQYDSETVAEMLSSYDGDDIRLPPPLSRHTGGFPLILRNSLESSSTIHSREIFHRSRRNETNHHFDATSDVSKNSASLSAAAYQAIRKDDLPRFDVDETSLVATEKASVKENADVSLESSESSILHSVPSNLGRHVTHDDDNVGFDTTIDPYVWFPNTIFLSILDNDRGFTEDVSLLQKTHSARIKCFVPVPQCLVRNSCVSHIRWHSSHDKEHPIAPLSSVNRHPVPSALDDGEKDMNSLILHDPIQAQHVAMELLRKGNTNGAIVVATNVLRRLKSSREASPSVSAQAATLQGQLIVLCLSEGRLREALHSSSGALLCARGGRTTTEDSTAGHHAPVEVDVLLRHGLVLYSTNKVTQAVKSWREAMQVAIAIFGYQDTTVACLLCNLGVLYLESGDIKAGSRSLEESVELQRSILSNGTEARRNGSADTAIYRLAVTMSNLAVAMERSGRLDRAIALLDESSTLYESIGSDTSKDVDILQQHMELLINEQRNTSDSTLLNSSIEAEVLGLGFACPIYDLNQSGNSATLQSFLDTSIAYEDDCSSIPKNSIDEVNQSEDSDRSMSLFGNFDGVPSRSISTRLSIEQTDYHDFLLLGSLLPERTAEERAQEALLTWRGKQLDREPDELLGVRVHGASELMKSSDSKAGEILKYKMDLDGETVVDADLYLNEIHKQALKYLDQNEVEAAINLFRSALRSHRAKYGEKHHLVGRALHNIGMVQFFARRYSEALATFEDAVLVRHEALGRNHPDLHSSLCKVGLLHFAMGNFHQAHDNFWDIRDQLVNDVKGFELMMLSKVNNNIGVIAYEFGDVANALESFKSSYDCLRQILKDHKQKTGDEQNDDDWDAVNLAKAYSLCNMAFIHVKAKNVERGLELYERAYGIFCGIFPKDHRHINEVRSNIDVLIEAAYHMEKLTV
jgi:tetratricopeptide (TPR) repeat protein